MRQHIVLADAVSRGSAIGGSKSGQLGERALLMPRAVQHYRDAMDASCHSSASACSRGLLCERGLVMLDAAVPCGRRYEL